MHTSYDLAAFDLEAGLALIKHEELLAHLQQEHGLKYRDDESAFLVRKHENDHHWMDEYPEQSLLAVHRHED